MQHTQNNILRARFTHAIVIFLVMHPPLGEGRRAAGGGRRAAGGGRRAAGGGRRAAGDGRREILHRAKAISGWTRYPGLRRRRRRATGNPEAQAIFYRKEVRTPPQLKLCLGNNLQRLGSGRFIYFFLLFARGMFCNSVGVCRWHSFHVSWVQFQANPIWRS